MKYVIKYGTNLIPKETDDPASAGFHLAGAMQDSNCFPWNDKDYNNTRIIINGVEFPPPAKKSIWWRTRPGNQYAEAVRICCEHINYCTDLYLAFYTELS